MSCAVLKNMLAHLNVRWYDHLPDTELTVVEYMLFG
jgi:hypothetical protein